METNDKITVILACLRGDVAGIYAQKKLNIMIQCFKGLSKELTLVLSDTRELDRVPKTK